MTKRSLSLSSLLLPNRNWNTLLRSSLSLLFSMMSCPSSLILLLCVRCFWPWGIFMDIFLSHTSACTSVLCWGALIWTQHSRCASPRLSRDEWSLLMTLWKHSSYLSPGSFALFYCKGTLLAMNLLALHKDSQVLQSCLPVGGSPVCNGTLHHSSKQRKGLAFSFVEPCEVLVHLSSLWKSPWMATQPTGALSPLFCVFCKLSHCPGHCWRH